MCYQRGVECKEQDRPKGVKAVYKRGKDGRCEETLKCEDQGWKLFDKACYRFFPEKKNYEDGRRLCIRHDVSLILLHLIFEMIKNMEIAVVALAY